MGTEVSTLKVEDSIFDANSVPTIVSGDGVDVTVRLNTGQFAFSAGQAYGYHVPIWRVDDGPVFGIPWAQCQSAQRYSQEAAYAGSWPNLQCANLSYTGPDGTYAHVLSLPRGLHTLWTGLYVMVSLCLCRAWTL